jgi:putative protein kinase ArgK-like GTPase of G3E family
MQFLIDSGLLETKGLQRSREELEQIMEYKLTRELLSKLQGTPEYEEAIKRISMRESDPYTVAERLITEFLVRHKK